MNLLEATQVVADTRKVFILRLNNGALVGSKISGSSDEDKLLFLEDPCFITLTVDGNGVLSTNMEPFAPVSLVKTTSGPISADNVMMMWEASEAYGNFYNRVVTKFNSDMANKTLNVVSKPEEEPSNEKKSVLELIAGHNKEQTEPEEPTNVITVDFKNRKRGKFVKAVAEDQTPPEDPQIA